jgi:hypothetical protein
MQITRIGEEKLLATLALAAASLDYASPPAKGASSAKVVTRPLSMVAPNERGPPPSQQFNSARRLVARVHVQTVGFWPELSWR